MKTAITAATAPEAIGPYSQAVQADQWLFLSGQIGLDPATGQVVSGGAAAEAERVLDNLAGVLAATGGNLDDIVRTTIYLTDLADFTAVNAVYANRFSVPYPARATVGVAALPRGARVEIDAIARLA